MKQLILPMKEQYEEYVIDESKFTGYGESISFPENEEEVRIILKELAREGTVVTIQGGKTGITGGAVPLGGHILNLSRMNHVKEHWLEEDGTGRIIVESGINLMDLRNEINSLFRKTPLFFPPDPTETSASIGGIAASNAQGITRLLYGDTRNYIESLHFMDYSGKLWEASEGQSLTLSSGKEIGLMDAVIGKEGVTGIITELTLKLVPKPECMWGIAFFFGESEGAGSFVDTLKEEMPVCEGASVAASEYMDRDTILMIESRKETMAKIKELPDIGDGVVCMVYLELHGEECAVEGLAEELMEMAMVCGSDPEKAWAVSGEAEVEKMHAFRHAAAETANLFIEEARRKDKRITKLGTDMAVANQSFEEVLESYRESMSKEGLCGCIFGHGMQNHLHVNILPKDYEEYQRGLALIRSWASRVFAGGGMVIGEHGIGKLKQQILGGQIPASYMGLCRELKTEFDEDYKLNPGNIICRNLVQSK